MRGRTWKTAKKIANAIREGTKAATVIMTTKGALSVPPSAHHKYLKSIA